MAKCKYYHVYQRREPPMEPGKDGTLITEYECRIASGVFAAYCSGDRTLCDLPDKMKTPNTSTTKTLRESEKGIDLHRVSDVDELCEELEAGN